MASGAASAGRAGSGAACTRCGGRSPPRSRPPRAGAAPAKCPARPVRGSGGSSPRRGRSRTAPRPRPALRAPPPPRRRADASCLPAVRPPARAEAVEEDRAEEENVPGRGGEREEVDPPERRRAVVLELARPKRRDDGRRLRRESHHPRGHGDPDLPAGHPERPAAPGRVAARRGEEEERPGLERPRRRPAEEAEPLEELGASHSAGETWVRTTRTATPFTKCQKSVVAQRP